MQQTVVSTATYVAENFTPIQVILFLLVFLVLVLGHMVWRAWLVMIERASPQKPSGNPKRPKRRK